MFLYLFFQMSVSLRLPFYYMENMIYVAPAVEVVEVEVECGFAGSDTASGDGWGNGGED